MNASPQRSVVMKRWEARRMASVLAGGEKSAARSVVEASALHLKIVPARKKQHHPKVTRRRSTSRGQGARPHDARISRANVAVRNDSDPPCSSNRLPAVGTGAINTSSNAV